MHWPQEEQNINLSPWFSEWRRQIKGKEKWEKRYQLKYPLVLSEQIYHFFLLETLEVIFMHWIKFCVSKFDLSVYTHYNKIVIREATR